MYQRTDLFRLRTVALLTLCAHPLFGGVVFDSSFGHPGPAPFAHSNYMIPASFGRLVNTNLFQSFSQFNLTNAQSATFCGPPNVHNILARVTDGNPSSIDGTIRSDIPGANLFFLNPAGVIFGQNAHINVSGSFAVSTANYLKLADGGRFYTSLGGSDVLTCAHVSAFGFLTSAPAPVSITGSTLNVASQKPFSAIAGDIRISGGQITGEGSRVTLVSVKSPGEVTLDATNINSPVDVMQFTAMGTIELTNLTKIDTSGPGGGPVVIRGGNLFLNNSQIFSETTGSIQGGGTDISADSIVIQNSSISALTNGSGNAGNVTLTAKSLLSLRDGQIYGDTGGSGNAGDVTLTAKSLVIDSTVPFGSVIQARTTSGGGNAGNIALTADSILIQGPSAIDTNSSFGIGNAGDVTLTANSFLIEGDLNSFPAIESSVGGTGGHGNGGNVTVIANSVVIGPFAAITAQTSGAGDPGSILVDARTLQFKQGGFISSSTFGTRAGGKMTVLADSVLIDGGAGNLSTGIFARTEGSTGNGGDITVTATDLVLQNGGVISAESTSGTGNAGEIVVHTDKLRIKDQGAITTTGSGSGHAGSITVHADDVKMQDGSIASSSTSSGEAGSIELVSDGTIRLWDHSAITVSAPHTNGGDITIKAPVLVSLINSKIDATAGKTGGNITIDSIALQLKNSKISASAGKQGGHIDLFTSFLVGPVETVTPGVISLAFNSFITATGGTANGTVNVTAPALDLGAELITLPTSLLSAENQLQERCTALLQGDFSSFISIGRGGTEPAPEELQSTF